MEEGVPDWNSFASKTFSCYTLDMIGDQLRSIEGKAMNRIPFSSLRPRSNYVMHRQRGDIQGCTPAVDVFVAYSEDEARAHVIAQADKYCNAIRSYVNGAYGGQHGLQGMWRDATKGNVSLTVIRNPSKPLASYK